MTQAAGDESIRDQKEEACSELPMAEKRILMGVTGGIAAYKSCEILRMLQKEGAAVRVVMTGAAQKFVTAMTFEALSGYEVMRDLFPNRYISRTPHIQLAEWADAMLVCPATANCIGKVANGIADDLLTTLIMAARATVVFAPAMDFRMEQNPVYAENVRKLEKLGYGFVSSEYGDLASGLKGSGRLAHPERIIDHVHRALADSDSLSHVRVTVTAGPTRENLDPVRFLSNPSSGKTGIALAREAFYRGADVTLITGTDSVCLPESIRTVYVRSADEMFQAVKTDWQKTDVLLMAAAVADFCPAHVSAGKIKKDKTPQSLELARTPDILKWAGENKGNRILVGFALETENEESRGIQKLRSKNLDLICINNPMEKGAGFAGDTNRVTLVDKHENPEKLPLMPKWKVARTVWDRTQKILGKGS